MHRVCHKRQQAGRQEGRQAGGQAGGRRNGACSRRESSVGLADIPSKVKPTNCQQLQTTPLATSTGAPSVAPFPASTLAAYYRPVELVEAAV